MEIHKSISSKDMPIDEFKELIDLRHFIFFMKSKFIAKPHSEFSTSINEIWNTLKMDLTCEEYGDTMVTTHYSNPRRTGYKIIS